MTEDVEDTQPITQPAGVSEETVKEAQEVYATLIASRGVFKAQRDDAVDSLRKVEHALGDLLQTGVITDLVKCGGNDEDTVGPCRLTLDHEGECESEPLPVVP